MRKWGIWIPFFIILGIYTYFYTIDDYIRLHKIQGMINRGEYIQAYDALKNIDVPVDEHIRFKVRDELYYAGKSYYQNENYDMAIECFRRIVSYHDSAYYLNRSLAFVSRRATTDQFYGEPNIPSERYDPVKDRERRDRFTESILQDSR
jgi:tetratricopeptide (TPR) repeat protein